MKILLVSISLLLASSQGFAIEFLLPSIPVSPTKQDCSILLQEYLDVSQKVRGEINQCQKGESRIGPPSLVYSTCKIDQNSKSAWPQCVSLQARACKISQQRSEDYQKCLLLAKSVNKAIDKGEEIASSYADSEVRSYLAKSSPHFKHLQNIEHRLNMAKKIYSLFQPASSQDKLNNLSSLSANIAGTRHSPMTNTLMKLAMGELNKINRNTLDILELGLSGFTAFGQEDETHMRAFMSEADRLFRNYKSTIATYYLDEPLTHSQIITPDYIAPYVAKKQNKYRNNTSTTYKPSYTPKSTSTYKSYDSYDDDYEYEQRQRERERNNRAMQDQWNNTMDIMKRSMELRDRARSGTGYGSPYYRRCPPSRPNCGAN